MTKIPLSAPFFFFLFFLGGNKRERIPEGEESRRRRSREVKDERKRIPKDNVKGEHDGVKAEETMERGGDDRGRGTTE